MQYAYICTNHWFKPWQCNSEQGREGLCFHGIAFRWRQTVNKQICEICVCVFVWKLLVMVRHNINQSNERETTGWSGSRIHLRKEVSEGFKEEVMFQLCSDSYTAVGQLKREGNLLYCRILVRKCDMGWKIRYPDLLVTSWPWTSYITSLCLSLLNLKKRLVRKIKWNAFLGLLVLVPCSGAMHCHLGLWRL